MANQNIFLEDERQLHERLYAALLGPVPNGIEITAEGWPVREAGSVGVSEYRNRAADLWRTLHQTHLHLEECVGQFLRRKASWSDLRAAYEAVKIISV